ncbi:hypothetical protein [Amphritea pacifica]
MNGSVVNNPDQKMNADLALHERFLLLRRGKNQFSMGCIKQS